MKRNSYKKRLKLISEDIKRVFDNLPEEYMDLPVKGYEDIGTLLSNIEIASDLKSEEFINWKPKFEIPTHDPQTGELNPYYEILKGWKNPLLCEEYKDMNPTLKTDYLDENISKMPDQKLHQIISFIKSGVRIVGYIIIPFSLFWAVCWLILSEVIGIVEELV